MYSISEEEKIKGAEVEAKLTEAVDQLKLENEKCTETEQCLLKDENKISAMESEFQKEELLHQQSIQAISEHLETLRNQVQDIRRRMQDFDKGNREMQREIGKVKNDIAALYRDANADMKNLAVCLNDFLKEYLEAEKAYEKDRDRIERLKNIMILALRDWEEESIPSRSGTGKMDEGNVEQNFNWYARHHRFRIVKMNKYWTIFFLKNKNQSNTEMRRAALSVSNASAKCENRKKNPYLITFQYLKAGKAYEKDRDRIEQLKDILILALKNCEEESIPTRFGTDKMDEGNVEQSI
ncbi:unnamed protein product [Thelazia callipaeda]|uniref:Uncharacterized protein n=1 Tax=Thelazia callipaeda TaxID=103827 RepID=A0A0N5CRU9_THECL|nr:unnamed protein product [Thelazia callipaeda]